VNCHGLSDSLSQDEEEEKDLDEEPEDLQNPPTPKPYTFNPKPDTFNPNPYTFNPKPCTFNLNPRHFYLKPQLETFRTRKRRNRWTRRNQKTFQTETIGRTAGSRLSSPAGSRSRFGSEEGSYLRLTDCCITQLWAGE